MVVIFTYLIMAKKMSPVAALVVVPIVFALIGGFWSGLGDMMMEGLKQVGFNRECILPQPYCYLRFCSSAF